MLFNISPVIANEPLKNNISKNEESSVYPASFFEQYTPQNALEMVQRLPGFSFDQGSNARGFGGNAGNVLIDGSRPTSKSGGLRSALIRIPAAQVARIEIIRGGIGAGEASGQSVIANVIRQKTGTTGTWALKFRLAPNEEHRPNIEASIATTFGEWNSSFDTDIGGIPEYRTALIKNTDVNGYLESSSEEFYPVSMKWMFVNTQTSKDFSLGKLSINSRIGLFQRKSDTTRNVFIERLPDNSPFEEYWVLNEQNKRKEGEVGIDWVQNNNDWKLHLIGLGVMNDNHYENTFYYEDIIEEGVDTSYFSQDGFKSEFILRTTYGLVDSSKFKPEFGFEIANNMLDTELQYIDNGIEQALDSADVIVEEIRGEAFATFVYQANEKLSIDGGVTVEVSKIEVSGDAKQSQKFQFIKPRLSLNYKLDDKSRITIEAERSVGQLNFNAFAASSQAADDRTTSGNPDLEPSKTTSISATYDLNFNERGSFKVHAFHQWRSDILEQIILPSGGQGLGNAGSANFWGIETEINLPLDYILPNGLLEVSHVFRDSSFDDLITNTERDINGYSPRNLSIKLRQDINKQKISWGIEYAGDFDHTQYLVDEVQTFHGKNRWLFFIETTRFFGVKTQLEIKHLNTGEYTRSRFYYVDDRSGAYDGSQVSVRQRKPEFKLSFFGSF